MVDQQLTKYIETQLRKGYSAEALRNFLINYGYAPDAVDDGINYVYNHHVPHVRFIIFVGIMIAIIVSGIFFYAQTTTEPEQDIFKYTLSISNPKITHGEALSFTNDFEFENKQKYDIQVEYTIVNKKTNKKFDNWKETVLKNQEIAEQKTYDTKKLVNGDYKLVVDIAYSDTKKQYFKSFKIVEEKEEIDLTEKLPEKEIVTGKQQTTETSCFDGIQNQGEQGIDCGGSCKICETCFDGIKNQNEQGPDCEGICEIPCSTNQEQPHPSEISGIKGEEDYQIRDNALALASNNPNQSFEVCKTVVDGELRNDCFSELAKIGNNSVYCNGIINTENKDSCLWYFVKNYQEFNVCQGLHDDQFKAICKGLEDLEKIKKVQQQENKTDEQKGEELLKALNITVIEQPAQPVEIVPEITAVGFNYPNEKTANITWATNILGDSAVYYGIDETKLTPIFDGALTSDHTILLQNLDQNTQYIFKVRSVMNNKVKESDYYSFVCCQK